MYVKHIIECHALNKGDKKVFVLGVFMLNTWHFTTN